MRRVAAYSPDFRPLGMFVTAGVWKPSQRLEGSQRAYRVRSTPMTGRDVATQRFFSLGPEADLLTSNGWNATVGRLGIDNESHNE
jgi:hypothetical protein